jgi:ubiquinone/menaquinone biosynthesis C-methylase UbiE
VDLASLRGAEVDYERVLSRNTRHQLKRSVRLYGTSGKLAVDAAENADAAVAHLHELAALHQAVWISRQQPGAFASPRFVAFHEALIRRAFPRGAVQVLRVRAGEVAIGLVYCLVERGHAYFYQSGLRYGPDNRFKPGFVVHAAAVEYWRRRGLAEYNFLAGDRTDARYKEALSTASRRLAWAIFRRGNPRMTALALLRAVKHGLTSRDRRDDAADCERARPPSTSELEIQGAYRGRSVAQRYVTERFTGELNRLLHDRQVGVLQALMQRARPTRILEIAAGPGRLTRDLRPTGPLLCAEYNEGMVEEGRRVCGDRVRWVRSDGFRLPLGQAFDLVYAFRFIRHFQRTDRFRLYAEVRRVLKPGGLFALDAVNERVSRPLRERHPEQYPIHDELYTAETLRTELHEAGFDVTLLEPVQKYFRWQYRSQVFLARAAWLNRFVIRSLERLPRRHGLEWVVVCRRG